MKATFRKLRLAIFISIAGLTLPFSKAADQKTIKSDEHLLSLTKEGAGMVFEVGRAIPIDQTKRTPAARRAAIWGSGENTNEIKVLYVPQKSTRPGLAQGDYLMLKELYYKITEKGHFLYQLDVRAYDKTGEIEDYPIQGILALTTRRIGDISNLLTLGTGGDIVWNENIKFEKGIFIRELPKMDTVQFVDSPNEMLKVLALDNPGARVIEELPHGTPLFARAEGSALTEWYAVRLLDGKTGYAKWKGLKSYPLDDLSSARWDKYPDKVSETLVKQVRAVKQEIKAGGAAAAMVARPALGLVKADVKQDWLTANYRCDFKSLSEAMAYALYFKKVFQAAFEGDWGESLNSIEINTAERNKAYKVGFASIRALTVVDGRYVLSVQIR